MSGPLRALFMSEGALGIGTVGHGRIEPAIRAGLAGRDDVQARYVTLPPQGPVAKTLARGVPGLGAADLDLQAVRWHLVQAVRARRLLERELRRAPVDVVHVVSHSIGLGMVDAMRRVPVVLSADVGIWAYRQFALWSPLRPHSRAAMLPSIALERRALGRAALVLAWSDWARQGIEREAPAARSITHHPGIDLQAFRPAPRRPRERARVLFVGGRFAEKGGQDALDAVEIVRRRHDLELDLVTFESVAAPPGVRVHRAIAPEQVRDLLQQADVVLAPTHADASPWAVLEAMACSAAIISTRVGGVPELLGDGDAGVLVPPRNPRALAEALAVLIDDRRRRVALGEAARARAQAHYDARRQTARLVELIAEARAAWAAARPDTRSSRGRASRAGRRG
ncbi:MAG TPA: glycosyltransferase family 4 protein [Solirubrobacteraceae bacterium]|nr:glycosyltransferase family 4 protein [Solirubrobacteraceae bacterium]